MLSLRLADLPGFLLEPKKRQRYGEKQQTRPGQTRPDQTENSRSCSWNVCNCVFSGTEVGKKTPCSRCGRPRNHPGGARRHGPRRFPSRPQTAPRTSRSALGGRCWRPRYSRLGDHCRGLGSGCPRHHARGLVTVTRGSWQRDAADAAGLGSNNGYQGSREGWFPQTPRGLVTLNGGRRGAG